MYLVAFIYDLTYELVSVLMSLAIQMS